MSLKGKSISFCLTLVFSLFLWICIPLNVGASSDVTGPVIRNLSISHTTINGGETMSISAEVFDETVGFIEGRITYFDELKAVWHTYGMDYNELTNQMTVDIYIGDSVPNGTYSWDVLEVTDVLGNETVLDISDRSFIVVNNFEPDIIPPTLSNFTISKTNVVPGEVVEFTLDIQDDREINHAFGQVNIQSPSDDLSYSVEIRYDSVRAKMVGSLEISSDMLNGIWKVDYLSVHDEQWNNSDLNLVNSTITISGASQNLIYPSVVFNKQVFSPGDSIVPSLSIQTTREIYGIAMYLTNLHSYDLEIGLSNSQQSSNWTGSINVEPTFVNGDWTVGDVNIGFNHYQARYSLDSQNVGIKIENATPPDIIPPTLSNPTISKSTATVNEVLYFTVDIQDDRILEYPYAWIDLQGPTSSSYALVNLEYDRKQNKMVGSLTITSDMANGDWYIAQISGYDDSNNSASVSYESTEHSFNVFGAREPDVTPPSISNFSVSASQVNAGESVKISLDVTDNESTNDSIWGYVHIVGPQELERWIVELFYNSSSNKFEGVFNTETNMSLGVWNVMRVSVYDQEGNEAELNLTNVTINVNGAKDPSLVAPEVVLSDASLQVGQTLSISVPSSNLPSIYESSPFALIYFYTPSDDSIYTTLEFDSSTKMFTGSLKIENDALIGTYKVRLFGYYQSKEQHLYYYPHRDYSFNVVSDPNADVTPPVITVDYFDTTPTSGSVVVTVSTNEGTLNVTSHTFTENGSFEFIATDDAGNVSRKIVTISHIYPGADQTKAFISRFYELVLNRTTDTWGLNDWTTKLLNGERSGADVANGFVFSDEFKDRAVSDEQYVNIMYEAFFNRSADAGGYANWMDALSKGMSRYYVLRGFTDSQEFKDLASSYGINPGSLVLSQPADLYPDITAFVTRFYKETLNRMPDEGGLNDWVNQLQKKTRTGADVAYGFIFSDEFKAKNLSNDLFVKTLYSAFFGRQADEGGYNDWMNRLASGQTREQVLKGFLGSAEFRDLCTKYGINPGI